MFDAAVRFAGRGSLIVVRVVAINIRYQPCRCLWRGSALQMIRRTRLRRICLQLRQSFFTDALTFISHLVIQRIPPP
jgi:hypothetical protein